jgi:formylmethanofuran dehydrogenase subunit E
MADLSNETAERLGHAAYKAYTRLRTEQMQDGRVYPAWDELELLERFAWETAAVAVAEAERARIRQRLVGCPQCGEIHTEGREADHPNKAPWRPRDPGALPFLDELLGDGPLP